MTLQYCNIVGEYRVEYWEDEHDEEISPVMMAPNQRHVRPNLDNISTAFLSQGFFSYCFLGLILRLITPFQPVCTEKSLCYARWNHTHHSKWSIILEASHSAQEVLPRTAATLFIRRPSMLHFFLVVVRLGEEQHMRRGGKKKQRRWCYMPGRNSAISAPVASCAPPCSSHTQMGKNRTFQHHEKNVE